MKQATGELNMSVIVVLIVAGLSTFFFSVLWPMIKSNVRNNANCDEAICPRENLRADGRLVDCYVKGHPDQKLVCTWKG